MKRFQSVDGKVGQYVIHKWWDSIDGPWREAQQQREESALEEAGTPAGEWEYRKRYSDGGHLEKSATSHQAGSYS